MAVLVGTAFSLDGVAGAGAGGLDSYISVDQLSDGRLAIAWQQDAPDVNGLETGRRYYVNTFAADGSVMGVETLLDHVAWAPGDRYYYHPTGGVFFGDMIAHPTDGTFSVAYIDATSSPYEIWQVTIDADGAQTAFRDPGVRSGFNGSIGLSAGGYVTVFTGYDPDDLIINSVGQTMADLSPQHPYVTPFGDGYVLMFMADTDPTSATDENIVMSIRATGFDASPRIVNQHTASYQQYGINARTAAQLADGGVVFTWVDNASTTIRVRILDSDGNWRTDEITVPGGTGRVPEIAALDTGGFVVEWAGYLTGSDIYGINLLAFSADGTAIGEAFRVTSGAGSVSSGAPHSVTDLGGGWVFTAWANGAEPQGVRVDLQLPGVIRGTSAGESLIGGAAAEQIFGQEGDDVLKGGGGLDLLDGGLGVDVADYRDRTGSVTLTLAGAEEATARVNGVAVDIVRNVERVYGGAGRDTLTGDTFNNLLDGFGGNDTLRGGRGDDSLLGGLGNDILDGGAGTDSLDGGLGVDTASYFYAGGGVRVNLGFAGPQNTVSAGIDTLTEIENLNGSRFGDTLTGGISDNVINGNGGADRIRGGNGADTLTGGAGADTFLFGYIFDSDGDDRDRITDLSPTDIIDLRGIDANGASGAGNTAFVRLAGDGAFTAPGQMRLTLHGPDTWLELNVDADTDPETVIILTGNHTAEDVENGWLL